jgi:hypothetical protein
MILQNKQSGNIIKYNVSNEQVVEEKINPVEDVDLDKLLADINKLEVNEVQMGNMIKEPENKKNLYHN